MASKRVVCPKCGSLVGIPALQPTRPGGAAPMTPLERLRHARDRQPLPVEAAPPPVDRSPDPVPPGGSRRVRLISGKVPRRPDPTGAHLEKHWYNCLSYPLRAWRICLGLAVMLSVLTAMVAMLLPHLLADPPTGTWALVAFHAGWVAVVLFTFGLPCSFLEAVLESASAGEVYYIRWSGGVTLTGPRWLACFLAGPAIFAGAACLYWLSCGDPTLLDGLILLELVLVAICFQIYTLMAITDRGQFTDLNPVTVADLAYRLGWRGFGVVLASALLLLVHGWALLAAVTEVHHGTFVGWLLLAAAWASAVYFSTCLCRLLGIWCFRSRKAFPVEPVAPPD